MYFSIGTNGDILLKRETGCSGIELLKNGPKVSCIAAGFYELTPEF